MFGILPGELRSQIFSLTLVDFPDPSPEKHYAADTCYTRPTYFAPRKSDTRLLRTCRAVYQEAWFLPFILREQTHWLTSQERAPPEYDVSLQRPRLCSMLQQVNQQHGGERVEIKGLRVFAQMVMLEEGYLATLLGTPHLHPRSLTLTIRHADWWWWEQDKPLRFEGSWIARVCAEMSPSVHEVRIELESLERKKDQVDAIAKQMIERWFFKRKDGVILYPNSAGTDIEVGRWTGASTWHGHTWTKDETRPGQIDYYITSIVFRPARDVKRGGGRVSETVRKAAEADIFSRSELRLRYMARSASTHTGVQVLVEEQDEDDSWSEEMDEDEDEDEGEEAEDSEPEGDI